MGKITLTSVHKRRIALAMFAMAALMLLDTVYQLTMHVRWRYWIPATLAATTATTQPAATQPTVTQPATAAAKPAPPKPLQLDPALKKRNIMAPSMPKKHGMRLTGVLGNSALFTTRKRQPVWIEQGKSNQGVKVTAIDGYTVTIEYRGKTETIKLFPEERGPGGARPTPPMPKPQSAPARTSGEKARSTQPKGTKP